MKKYLAIAAVATMAFGLANPVSAAKKKAASIYPSFGFVQEFAGVAKKGEISADIYNSAGYPFHLRIGAFGGEVLIDPSTAPATATGIGYKHPINPNLALYGKLFVNSAPGGQTNISVGVSYTGQSGKFLYNGNGHFTNATAGNVSTFLINGAGFYRLDTRSLPGLVQLGGELSLQISPSPTQTNLFLGGRWVPNKNVLIDLGLATSGGGTTTIQTPAFVRLNLRF